jgi:hypothetical protein
MANSHVSGTPMNIVKFNDSVDIGFDKTALEGLLLHPEVRNRKIVVFSIVGAFRKGKSFFLDYCLRYLYAHVSGRLSDQSDLHYDFYLTSTSQSRIHTIL